MGSGTSFCCDCLGRVIRVCSSRPVERRAGQHSSWRLPLCRHNPGG